MFGRAQRLLLIVGFLSFPAVRADAQVPPIPGNLPSPTQAQLMLQTNPSLVARLQQMMMQSGLSPDEIRARLRAQGYPENFLDQYLPGSATRADSLAIPGEDVFAAVRALGISDTLSVDSLTSFAKTRRTKQVRSDSAFFDTLQKTMRTDTIVAAAIRSLLKSRDLQREQIDSGFSVFGLNLFDNETSQFDASSTAGADPNYRFGTGDRLVLFLTGDVEKSYQLTVNGQGFVVIQDVGEVEVAGKTRTQLEDLLYTRLSRVYSGISRSPNARTRFFVDVGTMGANQIFVHGDVKHPGSYRISRAGTIMTALYKAGGPTANGSMRTVEVRRGGELVGTLDVYDYIVRGDGSNDARLENGDIVFVPARGPQVRVSGAVQRPATYEAKGNESVGATIRAAGGFAPAADRRRVQVDRIVPPSERTTAGRDRTVVDVVADAIETTPVRGGDVVRVLEVAKRVTQRVFVRGDVWSPGAIGYANGMTLYDAFRRVGGLRPDAFLGDVLITRLNADSTLSMLRTVVLDTTGRPITNIPLADGDDVTVFSTTDMRPKRFITVGGAVRKPGAIPYRDGMTLRDAVLLAGGLQEGALLTEAEIAHLPENRAGGVTAVPARVALDSTYLFDRGADGKVLMAPGLVVPSIPATPVELRPYDAVMIKWQPDWQLQQMVSVMGEVRYPSQYALITKTERLSDVLKRAGGLSASAYPNGVVFYRKKGNVGRIGVDLPEVLKNPTSADNLQLVDGDSIFIPRFNPVVVVRGAVNSPVGVAYVDGAPLSYYVRSAGGATALGDRDAAYVTQPNGKVETRQRQLLFFHSTPHPLAGSTVFVPNKDPNDRHDWASIATATTGILGSLVAITALIKR
jgi:protein involved in polysaccharide export with SLBB domain